MWNIQTTNKYYRKQLIKIAVFLCLLFPGISRAGLEISEIMYDLEIGSDNGREWIELFNNSSEEIDLSNYFLFEAETNHRIKSIVDDGNTLLEANSYAILVDNPEKFILDYKNFSGLVLDSVFSLKNSGELLVLRDSDLVNVDEVNYLPEWGADGDGKSLQKIEGRWQANSSSLGKINCSSLNGGESSPESTRIDNTVSSMLTGVPEILEINIQTKIKALEYLPIAGADFALSAQAYGLEGKILENAKYIWALGDGSRKEGQNILQHYSYPGDYMVVLETISGEYAESTKMQIKVISPEIAISEINRSLENNFIEINNFSNYQLDLSWWRLQVDNDFFTLAKNTILLPKSSLKLAFEITKLIPQENSLVRLLYPNGMVANTFVQKVLDKAVLNIKENIVSVLPKKVEIQEQIKMETLKQEKIGPVEQSDDTSERFTNKVYGANIKDTDTLKEEKSFFKIDKWSLLLLLIVSFSIITIIYASRLDNVENKEF